MNLLGTHDTERILSLLGDNGEGEGLENSELAVKRLTPTQKKVAIRRLKLASILQFTVYGVPSVYYGDEAGLEGYHDPFCRRPYPWGRENTALLAHYRKLGALRARNTAFKNGDFAFCEHHGGRVSYLRNGINGDRVFVAANVESEPWELPLTGTWKNALTGKRVASPLTIPPETAIVLENI